eukprot:363248-Chlamydomonas_euryale.AAC.7
MRAIVHAACEKRRTQRAPTRRAHYYRHSIALPDRPLTALTTTRVPSAGRRGGKRFECGMSVRRS